MTTGSHTGEVSCQGISWSVDGQRIVSDVTANFAPGKCTAVIGTNGSGKTSLLHLLGGLKKPSAGEIMLDHRLLSGLSRREIARSIAVMEQLPQAKVVLSARDVVALGRIPHSSVWGVRSESGCGQHIIDEVMARLGLSEIAERPWSALSGGERQWVQLARTLAQQPRVLLLDEPTNHLDLAHQIKLLRVVTSLGLTAIVVLHDLDLAVRFADELLVMDHGEMVAHGRASEMLTSSLIERCFGVIGEMERGEQLRFSWRGLVGDRQSTAEHSSICATAMQ